MPHKARAINKRTQNPQALWKRRFEGLWNLGILKGSEAGGVPVAHLRKSTQSDWGELQGLGWKYYTGSALSNQKRRGLPGRLHRSISVRHTLVWVVFPIHFCPSESCTVLSAVEGGTMPRHRRGSWVSEHLKNQFWHILPLQWLFSEKANATIWGRHPKWDSSIPSSPSDFLRAIWERKGEI